MGSGASNISVSSLHRTYIIKSYSARTLFYENSFQLLKWIESFRFDLEKFGIGRVLQGNSLCLTVFCIFV